MTVRLQAADARLLVEPADGGRLTSLTVGESELFARGDAPAAMQVGCFVMAPYAGRVRHGLLPRPTGGSSAATGEADPADDLALPLSLPPHAAHGLVLDRPWEVLEQPGDHTVALRCDFDERWPFGGWVEHRLTLAPGALSMTLSAYAEAEAFPASLGWHPWFARRLHPHDDDDALVQLGLTAEAMLARDHEGITTPERVPIPPPPWDDCFVDVAWPVRLRWPGRLRLEVDAGAGITCAVVFTHQPTAVCVEPQTAPPDAVRSDPVLVRADRPLHATTTWRWASDVDAEPAG